MHKAIIRLFALTALLACGEPGPSDIDAPGVVLGRVYLDADGDGAFGAGELPLPGVTAALLVPATDDTVARAQSIADGTFVLASVAAGVYRLEVDLGAMRDTLAFQNSGDPPIVVTGGDTTETQVDVGYSATPVTVAAARTMQAGQRVIVSGVAISSPAMFGDSSFHVSDATGSIRVIQVRNAVVAGERVRFFATIDTRSGQPVLRATTAVVALDWVGAPAPDSVATGAAASAANGVLDAARVAVSGIIRSAGMVGEDIVLRIDDGSGLVSLALSRSAGFTSAYYEVGQTVRARGVLVPAANGTRWELWPSIAWEVVVTIGEIRCSSEGFAGPYACRNVDLVAQVPITNLAGGPGHDLNDIWGWTDPVTAKEYAIVGRTDGTAFVDLSDPLRPRLVANLPFSPGARASVWRDMKVYRNHVYVVADGAGQHGMQVVDLTRLRQYAGTTLQLTPDALYREIASAHNIVINEATGFAYAVGASAGGRTCGGGLHMIDIRQPTSPQFAGCFADVQTGRAGTGYTHDAQCVTYAGPDQSQTGREICFGSNETALSIADVTDHANPRVVSRASYPNVAYSHQGWLSEDQRYLFMNDELDEGRPNVSRTRTLIWDVADLDDPQLVAQHAGVEASTDHNLYIRGNLMYQANYKSGLRILDITVPAAPIETGFFDTTQFGSNSPGFFGSWSSYPFFNSGLIVVSSINEGLFVLRKR